jgi:hypothetical protein
MNKIFQNINIRNIDSNTEKQMSEDGWRIAGGEEEKAFLGYFLNSKTAVWYTGTIRVILFITLGISLGMAGFEYTFKTDTSYNPVPSIICIVLSLYLLLINEVVRKIIQRKALSKANGNVYVIDAKARFSGNNKVFIQLNDTQYNSELFVFNESVNPMDYIHDESGRQEGFRCLLYILIYDDKIQKKLVLGSDGYRIFLDKYRTKFKK